MNNPTSKSNAEATDFFSKTSIAFQGSYSSDPDFIERQTLWARLVEKHSQGKKTALDLGCGPGVLTLELLRQNLAVTALDGSVEMVKLCEKNTAETPGQKPEYLHDYLPALPKLEGRKFDIVLCSSVLEYVDDLEQSLQRISALLPPGGFALISMPNRASLYRKVETLKFQLTGKPAYRAHVKNMLTKDEFAQSAAAKGLRPLECLFYGRGNGLAATLAAPLKESARKNLFLWVLEKG